MANKKIDNILNEIDAFIEEEKKPKRKRRTKKEIEVEKMENEEIVEEVIEEVKPKKRGRKKKEVIEEQVEQTIEDVIEDNRVVEETAPVPTVEEENEEDTVVDEPVIETITTEISVQMDEEEDDDLYLTKSFKPIKKKKRLKRNIVRFFKILIILGVIGLIGWVVGTKIYGMYLSTRPVNIYKTAILETGKTVNSFINSIPSLDNGMFEMQFKTNMKSYEFLNNTKVGYGNSDNEEGYEDYIYYIDGNYERNGLHTLVKNNKVYKKYDVSDVVYSSKLEENMMRDILQETDIDMDIITDVIEGNSKVISSILKEDDIEVSSEELDINGITVNVRCNTMVLSDSLVDRYLDELYKNKVLVNKMSKLFDKDSDVLRRYLEGKISKYVDDLKFNLYVTDKYDFVGFDYELDGFREMYYYQYKDNKDINVKLSDEINLGVDVKDKDVNVLVDNESMFNLVIKEFEKNVINLQYKNSDSTVSMDILIKKDDIVIEYKNDNGKFMDVVIKLFDYEKVIDINDVTTSSKKINEANERFKESIKSNQKDAYNLIYSIIYGN